MTPRPGQPPKSRPGQPRSSRPGKSAMTCPDGPLLQDASESPPADDHVSEPPPADDHASEPPPVDDFTSQVLDVVDAIPPGRVMSYGDIAAYLAAGPGPRQVGKVMSVYGGAVAWWRVIHSDGTPAPGHDSVAVQHYLAEGTPLRSARPPVRVDMRRARWPGP